MGKTFYILKNTVYLVSINLQPTKPKKAGQAQRCKGAERIGFGAERELERNALADHKQGDPSLVAAIHTCLTRRIFEGRQKLCGVVTSNLVCNTSERRAGASHQCCSRRLVGRGLLTQEGGRHSSVMMMGIEKDSVMHEMCDLLVAHQAHIRSQLNRPGPDCLPYLAYYLGIRNYQPGTCGKIKNTPREEERPVWTLCTCTNVASELGLCTFQMHGQVWCLPISRPPWPLIFSFFCSFLPWALVRSRSSWTS